VKSVLLILKFVQQFHLVEGQIKDIATVFLNQQIVVLLRATRQNQLFADPPVVGKYFPPDEPKFPKNPGLLRRWSASQPVWIVYLGGLILELPTGTAAQHPLLGIRANPA